jgi:hypothetical protein
VFEESSSPSSSFFASLRQTPVEVDTEPPTLGLTLSTGLDIGVWVRRIDRRYGRSGVLRLLEARVHEGFHVVENMTGVQNSHDSIRESSHDAVRSILGEYPLGFQTESEPYDVPAFALGDLRLLASAWWEAELNDQLKGSSSKPVVLSSVLSQPRRRTWAHSGPTYLAALAHAMFGD